MNKTFLKSALVLIIILVIGFVPHFINMFNYPYYENDEGTYMSQAWSLLKVGKLAPYTYWYDHAPAGWVLIAIWVKLTGGFFTFGTSVDSGRVLMLLIHIASSFLIYFIARKVSNSKLSGIIAVSLFSLSPLGIYFQRRVLLDNMMIFWVLVSVYILLKENINLKRLVLGAVTFGIAVLTKENAVFFMPVLIYLVYINSTVYQKEFFVWKFLFISSFIISTYFLYAILKGEFFPVGLLGDTKERVSLLTTLYNQYSRGEVHNFWDPSSDFYQHFIGWLRKDPLIMIGGLIATFINLIICIYKKSFRVPVFLSLMFLTFLARGKLVIDFYIVPMLPLFALNIGILVGIIIDKVSLKINFYKYLLFALILAIFFIIQNINSSKVYTKDETFSQIEAINWIKENLNESDKFVIDQSIYVDLHEERFQGDKIFPNADWFWKVEEDPQIYKDKLNENWMKIQYLIISHEMLKQINENDFFFMKKALYNSETIKMWNDKSSAFVDIGNSISTNGDWMAVQKITDRNSVLLDKSWKYYKDNFIKNQGQVIDPQSNNTTSEGQSYAMLRSVWADDPDTFSQVWTWSKNHLQFRIQDKLISWLWLNDDKGGKLGDFETASDADTDIALALLLANNKWGNEKYLTDAKIIIDDIWNNEVVRINNKYYLISGPSGKREDGYLVNPSYLSPASYRTFAKIDKSHNWNELAKNSYELLNQLADKSVTNLPPNWILVDNVTGEIKSPNKYISDPSSSWYGYDAFRVMYRVAFDNRWYNSPESVNYLKRLQPFFEKEVKNRFYAVYSLDGSPRVNYQQLSITTSAYFALSVVNPQLSKEIYLDQIEGQFNFDEGNYNDGKNYYDQNWSWFATAFYYGLMTGIPKSQFVIP